MLTGVRITFDLWLKDDYPEYTVTLSGPGISLITTYQAMFSRFTSQQTSASVSPQPGCATRKRAEKQ